MKRISPERKAGVLAKLLPPYNMTVTAVAQMEGISEATLYNWRNQAKSEGEPVPGAEKNSEQWPAEARLAVIVETATLSETEIAEYCRKKGLYPAQIAQWKQAFLQVPSGEERQQFIAWINEAVAAGARRAVACREVELSVRTWQRWQTSPEDQRTTAIRPEPTNRLRVEEEQQIRAVCHQPEYANLPPSQIVPRLADKGVYLASESTFYRVLRRHGEVHHRGRCLKPGRVKPPTTFTASGPCQVWTWDITWLPSWVRGRWYYLYLMEDVFSRKITGAEVHETESGELAAALMQRTVLRERCYRQPLVLHADNGAAMKSQTLQVKLAELNISPSHSRPRVSNDNAYVESLFRTLKYVPQWPSSGFNHLEEARVWVDKFTRWYNEEHRHSGIGYVTPLQRHTGEDKALLAQRDKVYQAARAANPKRWSRQTRNWEWQESVTLNPERGKQAA
ncbi:IS3 family transposase [Yersinia pseudotuberculosis]|uniref:IS3 family transposase n=2 Tax=Yersinia pseudotuberculosis TaxID=633 RepID=UPI0009B7F16A|nr:IS3 family transposase [Yersinia pseudotuberculosis]